MVISSSGVMVCYLSLKVFCHSLMRAKSRVAKIFKAFGWTMCAAGVLLTIGRFYLRWRKMRGLGYDDILNGAAALFLIALMITSQIYLPNEYDLELHDLGFIDTEPPAFDEAFNLKLTIAALILFWVVMFSVKASFLALYWHLFRVSKRFRIAWWITAVYTALSFVIIFLSILLRCDYKPQDMGNPGQ